MNESWWPGGGKMSCRSYVDGWGRWVGQLESVYKAVRDCFLG